MFVSFLVLPQLNWDSIFLLHLKVAFLSSHLPNFDFTSLIMIECSQMGFIERLRQQKETEALTRSQRETELGRKRKAEDAARQQREAQEREFHQQRKQQAETF